MLGCGIWPGAEVGCNVVLNGLYRRILYEAHTVQFFPQGSTTLRRQRLNGWEYGIVTMCRNIG